MIAALEGLSTRGRRSALDDKLPEGKRGGLTIIIAAPKGEEEPPSGESEVPPVLEDASEAMPEDEMLEAEDEDEDY